MGKKEDDAMGISDEKRREEGYFHPFSLFSLFHLKKKNKKTNKKEKIPKQKDQVGINLVGRS